MLCGGPRELPGSDAASVGCGVALISVVAPSLGGGVIASLSVAVVVLVELWVVPAPATLPAGRTALVGEVEPATSVESDALVTVVGTVAAIGAEVIGPLTVVAIASVVVVLTGTVVVATDVTVWVTGT
jgi:hypothetical protein